MFRTVIIMGLLSTLFGCKNEAPFSTPSQPPAPTTVTNDEEHNAAYTRGTELISPHMMLLEHNPRVTKSVREQVSRGIAELNAVTEYNPGNWAAFWVKGKGYQVLGEHAEANSEFKSSFAIQKENSDVAREYALTCMNLGLGTEAVDATQHAISLNPDNAGLYANLALALLIDGRNDDAKIAIDRSLEMDPQDQISQTVERLVKEVISGRRPQPKDMGDLQKD